MDRKIIIGFYNIHGEYSDVKCIDKGFLKFEFGVLD
jgi:hypothetical protein